MLVISVAGGLVACSALLGLPAAYALGGQADGDAKWTQTMASEPSDFVNGTLGHVSCPSADSCQAVGTYYDVNNVQHTLMQHYNGTSWNIVSSSDPVGAQNITINSLTCFSTSFCQAAGSYADSGFSDRPIIYTYTGTGWSLASVPEPVGGQFIVLNAIDCTSSTFCIATGSYYDGSASHSLIEKYNGTNWSLETPSDPVSSVGSGLYAVDCVSSTFCQAVGSYQAAGGGVYTQIQSYDGTNWTVAATTDPTNTAVNAGSTDIVCLSTTFCQTSGFYRAPDSSWHTILRAYDGSSWSTVSLTGPGATDSGTISDVDCSSTTFCQAAGSYYDVIDVQHPLLYAYDGTAWSITGIPEPSDFDNGNLGAVSCTSVSRCQTVGIYQDSDGVYRALVLGYDGSVWSVVSGLDPAGSNFNSLENVDCTSDVACQAVGVYQDVSSHSHPLILTYAVLGAEDPNPVSDGSGSSSIPRNITSWNFLTAAGSSYKSDANFGTTPSASDNPVAEQATKANQDKNVNVVAAKSNHNWWLIIVVGIVIIMVIGIGARGRTKKVHA